jgi:hypothetical protein
VLFPEAAGPSMAMAKWGLDEFWLTVKSMVLLDPQRVF